MSIQVITREKLSKAMTYEDYMQLFEKVVLEKSTTGPKQTENLIHFTKLNLHRTKRVLKTFNISADAAYQISLLPPQTWIVITETWCGDAAHSLGVIAKMAACNTQINLFILLRDENLEIMDLYLTNGARSIPVLLICEGEELIVTSRWGPRPAPLQSAFLKMKNEQLAKAEIEMFEQNWYNMDKGNTIFNEIIKMLFK
jgi:hypothetical protein